MSAAGPIFVCGGDTATVADPDPTCPRSDLHTPCPPGYIEWFDWAAARAYRGSTQSRCPGCDRYNVWSPGRDSR